MVYLTFVSLDISLLIKKWGQTAKQKNIIDLNLFNYTKRS
jgi:hypothetical protein